MKTLRAILIGIITWSIVFTAFAISASFNIINNPELQEQVVIMLSLIPAAWLGARFYYKANVPTNGFLLGAIMVATAIVLEMIITIPFFIIPAGGSYASFFSSTFFWIAMGSQLLVVAIYWMKNVYTSSETYECIH